MNRLRKKTRAEKSRETVPLKEHSFTGSHDHIFFNRYLSIQIRNRSINFVSTTKLFCKNIDKNIKHHFKYF